MKITVLLAGASIATVSASAQTKNLSVNNIDLQRHLAECNDGCSEVVEGEEAALKLFVANQQLAESVEPAVADLYNPSASPLGRVAPFRARLLVPADDVRDVRVLVDDRFGTAPHVARICAKVLAASNIRRGALDDDGAQYRVKLRDVMSVCSGHDERQRDATSVH